MKLRLLTAAFLSVALLSGCNNSAVKSKPAVDCVKNPVESACILSLAKTTLAEIESPDDWITGAAEYAEALNSAGRVDDAHQILLQTEDRVDKIETSAKKITALNSIASGLISIDQRAASINLLDRALKLTEGIETESQRWDKRGKLISSKFKANSSLQILNSISDMPETTENLAAFKARTLKEVAETQSVSGQILDAKNTIDQMTMGLTYYKSTALSHVAQQALQHDQMKLAFKMLEEAEKIARSQTDGYFIAGAIREAGKAYLRAGETARALDLFKEAEVATLKGRTPQHRARSLSRIATSLSDCNMFENAKSLLRESIMRAEKETSEIMQPYAFYEIAGSAAFSGDFDTAQELLSRIADEPFGDATSLMGATQRDVAWGLAKHGKIREAIDLASSISTPRERIQALSRIIRIIHDEDMQALPRYL